MVSSMQSVRQDIRQLTASMNADMLRREQELQDVEDDEESWQVQEQASEET